MTYPITRWLLPALAFLGAPALSHHSYAMFETSKPLASVSGTLAKFEFTNPHVFIWLYVEKAGERGQYDLYAFEGGSVGTLSRDGWTNDTLKASERLTIYYFPLKDGRPGGQFVKAVRADGTQVTDASSPATRRENSK